MAADESPVNLRTEAVAVGIDVGSTTVKAVVVDPVTKEILWSDYLRHQTKQAEFVLSFLERIAVAFPNIPNDQIRTFITGSGGAPIGPAHRVQVRPGGERGDPGGRDAAPRRRLGLRAGRPGRQDHHLQEERGDRRQDRHHLDERQVRLRHRRDHRQVRHQGRPAQRGGREDRLRRLEAAPRGGQVRRVRRDRHREPGQERHPVARDHELAGRRHRHAEPVGADAWEHAAPQGAAAGRAQHLPAVLARLLAQADPRDLARSRLRLSQGRPDRRADHRPRERAVLRRLRRGVYGLYENANVGVYKGMDGLKDFILNGRAARLGETAGPPLLTQGTDRGKAELDEFKKLYTIPKFQDATFAPGAGGQGRHRHGRRVDLVEGGPHRLRLGRAAQEVVHALQGQPDRRHQGDPGGAQDSTSPTRARPWRSWASAPPATPPTCSRSR